jgi:hypothetical protein
MQPNRIARHIPVMAFHCFLRRIRRTAQTPPISSNAGRPAPITGPGAAKELEEPEEPDEPCWPSAPVDTPQTISTAASQSFTI